jgi:predicted RNA-binding protein Jag
VSEHARRFTGATVFEALNLAAESFEVGGVAELQFVFDPDYYSTGSYEVELFAWVKELPEHVRGARNYVLKILRTFGAEGVVEISEHRGEDGTLFDMVLSGPPLNDVLGHGRYEAALRRLVREGFGWDLNLRSKRSPRGTPEEELVRAIHAAMEQVRSSGEAVRLEPMNSWARRLVHQNVSGAEDLATRSVGEGRDRQVEIFRASD